MNMIKYSLLILSLLISTACSKQNPSIEQIDIRGAITNTIISESTLNKVDSLLVESSTSSDTGYDKAHINITKDTVILKDDAKVTPATDYLNKDVIVEVQFTGAVLESYPVQATADIIRIITPTPASEAIEGQEDVNSIVNAYMLVIDSLYEEDSALNDDIKYLAIDTTKMINLTDTSKKQLLDTLKKYNLIVLDTTLEKLETEGFIKDLYFEKGILFKIEDQAMTNNTLALSASKWRSGLGAIGTDKMVLKKVKDTWKITDKGMRWIS